MLHGNFWALTQDTSQETPIDATMTKNSDENKRIRFLLLENI